MNEKYLNSKLNAQGSKIFINVVHIATTVIG
jgi:hypothetical protein